MTRPVRMAMGVPVVVIMMVMMCVYGGPSDFGHRLFQQAIRGGHIGGGLVQPCGQVFRAVSACGRGPFLEFGRMVLVMLRPVGE